jgi:hypothetical protein
MPFSLLVDNHINQGEHNTKVFGFDSVIVHKWPKKTVTKSNLLVPTIQFYFLQCPEYEQIFHNQTVQFCLR